jgi:hypothetical protein
LIWLRKNADTRKIDTIWDTAAWESRSDIDPTILRLILVTYRSREDARGRDEPMHPLLGHSIAHTIETVSLTEASGTKLNKSEIISLCHGYGGDSIYTLTDTLASLDIDESLHILHRIVTMSKVDEWWSRWMTSVSKILYIKYLKEHGQKESEIAQIMGLYPSAVQK